MSLLRNIRIPQNLENKFTHAFATCTRPSRLGLVSEATNKYYIKSTVTIAVTVLQDLLAYIVVEYLPYFSLLMNGMIGWGSDGC